MMKQLDTVEMWFLRRMLRIVWTDKVINEAYVDGKLLNDIVSMQMQFFAHVVREEELGYLVVQGFGERAQGRQRQPICVFANRKVLTPIELFHVA